MPTTRGLFDGRLRRVTEAGALALEPGERVTLVSGVCGTVCEVDHERGWVRVAVDTWDLPSWLLPHMIAAWEDD